MILEEQIISLFFSLFYGILASFITTLNYNIFFHDKVIIKVGGTITLIVLILLGYYSGLLYINCGVIHPYFLLILMIGFCIGSVNYKKIIVNFKNKSK